MQRTAGIFVAGLVLGILVTAVFMQAGRKETGGTLPNARISKNDSAGTTSSTQQSNAERDKVVLGNIATVPFQELYSVLSVRSQDEMAELARQLNELPPGAETKGKINAFFTAWAHLDANAALAAAISLKTPEAKGLAITSVIRGADAIAAKSLTVTLSQLSAEALPAWQKTRSLNSALSKWSEVDAADAAKFLDTLPARDREFFGARVTIAQNWASTDPTAALAWVQTQTDQRDARISMSGVMSGWWDNDPRAAEAYVAAHLDTVGPEAVMRITSQLYRQDPQRARDWANSLSTPEARRNADGYIAMQMAEEDPKAASAWAASLPEEVRSRALESVVSRWARNDLQAAGQWISNLNGTVRDEAVSAYSSAMASKDPATALTWAETVSDPKIRSTTVDRIVIGWMRRSPNDARAWIQNSALEESDKTRLLALPPRR